MNLSTGFFCFMGLVGAIILLAAVQNKQDIDVYEDQPIELQRPKNSKRYVLQGECKNEMSIAIYRHKNINLYADNADEAAYKGSAEMIEYYPTSEGYYDHNYTITLVQEVER